MDIAQENTQVDTPQGYANILGKLRKLVPGKGWTTSEGTSLTGPSKGPEPTPMEDDSANTTPGEGNILCLEDSHPSTRQLVRGGDFGDFT